MAVRTAKTTGRPLALVTNPASAAKITTSNRIDVSFRRVEIESGVKGKSMADRDALSLLASKEDESVTVRHLHLGQGLRVHHRILADNAVQLKDVGADRVDLVILSDLGAFAGIARRT